MNRTRSRARIIRGIALILASLIVGACASANRPVVSRAPADATPSLSVDGSRKDLELIATVEETKKAADDARNLKNYGPAAETYRTLLEDWDGFSAFAAKLTFSRGDVEAGLRICRVSLCALQARQELGAEHYTKALALYQAALMDYPGDEALRAGYAGAVDEIKAGGDRALAAKNFSLAGKIEKLLLKNLAAFKGLQTTAVLNGEGLLEAIKVCSTNLTSRGLAEYRKGNLATAIEVWQSLLAFEPENTEVKKAVETAKAQLGKLRSGAPGGPGSVGKGK